MKESDGSGDGGCPLAARLASLRGGMRLFDDRVDAGRHLAECLESLRGKDIVVQGLPLFFIDAASGPVSVLYHRYDGHYGLITPAG